MGTRQFNLADLFEVVVDTVPDRLALVAGPARLTYRELDDRANRFGHYVQARGIGTGAHVGILAHNCAPWAEAMVGCYKARTVPINLNFRYVAAELSYLIENADLKMLVFERALAPLVTESLADSGQSDAISLLVIDDGSATGPVPSATDYEVALGSVGDGRDFGPRSPDDIYALYTGGTTGMPKGVLWRQEDIFFAAMGGGGWGASPITRADELADRINTNESARLVMLVVAPLMHGNAQWVMWNAFMMGGTAVLYTDHCYDPDALWRLIGDEGVVSIGLVGDAMARPLAEALASAPTGTYDTSSLVIIGSGGAMLSATVKDELRKQLPNVMVMDRFGSSESGAQGAVEDGATGPRFAMSDDTSVLNEDLRPLTPGDGQMGRLARTGRIPIGYYKDRAKTEATFPVDADGVRWSVPGDLASVEPDGTITVHGRGSASINSGGEKIFPEEVEAAIKTHPDVFDAIVVGLPDDRFGERVAVVVQPRGGQGTPTLEDLQDHCRAHIAGYKIPRQMLTVQSIPLTAAGKPDGKAARALF
ncbi:MAG TPA: acyl-CoA synthetase [Acidimicrobiales bacterium]|jgi:fatty-acyl-CoA synthase|nr:acyl-CoA synthetase [Acidimicrobiales bacterium]